MASWGRFRSRAAYSLGDGGAKRSASRSARVVPTLRRLVDVEQRRAEEEHRGEHEAGQERGGTLGVVGEALQKQRDDDLGHEDEHRQRCEPAQRVDVVGPAEGEAPPDRVPDPERLRDSGRHGEADEREPREPGQDEQSRQKRERHVDEEAPAIAA